MDQLPAELIALIVSFLELLDPANLSTLATVSHKWQVAVEYRTFRSIVLKSNELESFAKIVSPAHRKAAIETLTYSAVLPAYSEDRCAKFERPREKHANDKVFSQSIVDLFSLLHAWEKPQQGCQHQDTGTAIQSGRPITLSLAAYSPTDVMQPRPYDDMGTHRYENSRLALLDPALIPCVHRITGFSTGGFSEGRRHIHAASVAHIGSKLPGLSQISWFMSDSSAFHREIPRHVYRTDFADALLTLNTQNLTSLTLFFDFDEPENEAFQIPSGVDPTRPDVDALSQALYQISLSPNLKTIDLSGEFFPSLFAPRKEDGGASESEQQRRPPLWPKLTHFNVELGRTTPDGGWYYVPDPDIEVWQDPADRSDSDPSDSEFMSTSSNSDADYSDDSMFHDTYHDYHVGLATGRRPRRHFRVKADPARVDPALLAAARACLAGKPALRKFRVAFGERSGCEGEVYWVYRCGKGADEVAGEGPPPPSSAAAARSVSVWAGPGSLWEPRQEMVELWNELAGEGGEVSVELL